MDYQALIVEGAEHYAAMCAECHLAPGADDTEPRAGLDPQPPNLSLPAQTHPAILFSTIKHGIKMTAMPAWGASHDDEAIWALLAFVRTLPGLTRAQYLAATGGNADHVLRQHEEAPEHDHAHHAPHPEQQAE